MSTAKDRKVPETEAREILRRAAELDAAGAGDLSLSEIEAVALEAGMSRAAVARAVAESGAEPIRLETPARRNRNVIRIVIVAVLLATALTIIGTNVLRERSITVQLLGIE